MRTNNPRHQPLLSSLLGVLLLTTVAGAPLFSARAQGFGDLGAIGSKGSGRSLAVATAPKVRVTATAQQVVAAPGSALAIAIVLEHAEHWHTWPAAEVTLPEVINSFAIRATIDPPSPLPAWVSAIGAVQWPAASPGPVPDLERPGRSIEVPVYQGRAVAFVPVFVSDTAAPGPASITLTVGFQACNDSTCEEPATIEVTIDMRIGEASETASSAISPESAALFAAFDARALAAPPETTTGPLVPSGQPSAGSNFYGFSLGGLSGAFGLIVLALLSAVGGLVLNLTPCVLPVIPIKVMTLTRHAGSRRQTLILGLWMAAGVVAFWVGLGIPATIFSSLADPSRLFGIWWLTAAIGLVIAAMGLGIMGLFTLNLPQQVYMVNPEADSPAGSFLFGVMTAVLGLPCFGFVAGALLPAAAAIGPTATMTVFASLGIGMALPYLVLSAKPSLVERLPRTGPASELVKQVMGLLLLAAAAYFVGSGMIALVQDYPYLAKQLHWWLVALLGAASGLWLAFRTIRITKRALPRIAFGLIGALIASGGILYAAKTTADARKEHESRATALTGAEFGVLITSTWVEYSEALLAKAQEEGKVVVMDFTAEWCLNCKALKAAVLNVDPVRTVLEGPDVVMVRVDLTSSRAPGWEKLRSLGQTGIPLLAVQGPGLKQPWLANAYTSDQVLEAIGRAAAKPVDVSADAR